MKTNSPLAQIIPYMLSVVMVLMIVACAKDDDNNTPDIIPRDTSIKLKASKQTIVPFEEILVSVDLKMDLLRETYDSITWQANGLARTFWEGTYDEDTRNLRLTDYRFGVFYAYAFGYKEGNIISKDSIKYEVKKPTGDFVHIRWGSNSKDKFYGYLWGNTPTNYLSADNGMTKFGGISIELYHFVEKKFEYATLTLLPWHVSYSSMVKAGSIPNINEFDRHHNLYNESRYEVEYNFCHSYMVELYGKPTFTYDGDDITQTTLQEEYNNRFLYDLSPLNLYPQEIWITPSSVICLSRANNEMGPVNQKGTCQLVAEPRVKRRM